METKVSSLNHSAMTTLIQYIDNEANNPSNSAMFLERLKSNNGTVVGLAMESGGITMACVTTF